MELFTLKTSKDTQSTANAGAEADPQSTSSTHYQTVFRSNQQSHYRSKSKPSSTAVHIPLMTITPRRLVYLGLILCFLGLLPFLFQKGLANAYHFKSRYYIDEWQAGKVVEPLQYANALLASDYAAKIDSNHPHYLLTQAKIMEWGVFAGLAVANNAKFNQLYQDAINLRVIWPNAYSDYAYNLAFIQHDMARAWQYLHQAAEYGPYSPEVIRQTLAIGMSHWPLLDVSQKQYVLQTSLLAANSDWVMRKELSFFVSENALTIPLCSYIKYQKQTVNANTIAWLNQGLCRSYLVSDNEASL